MAENKNKKTIDFVGMVGVFGAVSGLLVAASLILIFTKGLNYGIDFAGGTEMQVRFAQSFSDTAKLRDMMEGLGVKSAQVQKFAEGNEYLLRFESPEGVSEEEINKKQNERIQALTQALNTQLADAQPEIRRVDSVGPQVGSQLKRNGILAVFYSLILILIYVALRFDYKFAPGAVICLFHDAIITLGIFVVLGKEVNIQILAAVLTIIGYSLNDTIVIFDRIRENVKAFPRASAGEIINMSTNDMLGRTLLTAGTTMLSVLALYFLAGGVISDFALAMGIGVILGAYSTIYVASPFIIFFERSRAIKA